jgi:hypothetical protein
MSAPDFEQPAARALWRRTATLLDGVSYFAVIVSLLIMRIKPIGVRRAGASMFEQVREGWDYVRTFIPIRTILLLFALLSLMGWPYLVPDAVRASSRQRFDLVDGKCCVGAV